VAVHGVRESVGVRTGPGATDADTESAISYAQHFDGAFGRRFAAKALDALVVVRGARVLDVGCGTGIFARLAAHVAGASGRVVGIDSSAVSIDAARRIDATSNVQWVHDDMTSLPFDDGYFDVVACQYALHRFEDRVRIIEEMRRVLGPGGRLGITTWGPIEENPAFAVQLDAAVKAGFEESGIVDVLLDAFSIHRAEDLADLAAKAGLDDVSVRTVRMLVALPRAAEWVRIYPTMAPLARAWQECDQQTRVQFLARATELLRPFEHDGVLRVQASCRLLVARTRFA
jgi:ubiquinone/menaquinone biosynthesis C-methylase UbiE